MHGSAKTNEQKVRDFFAEWEMGFAQLCDSFRKIMGDKCLLIQSGLPDLRGPDQLIEFLRIGREKRRIETIRVDILRIIATEHSVVSERIDYLLTADKQVLATIPVAGIMDFQGDRIVGWREYFDSKVMDAYAGEVRSP